jgi:hypothetical protein
MRLWVIIALTELIAFAAQIQGMALHHALWEGYPFNAGHSAPQ